MYILAVKVPTATNSSTNQPNEGNSTTTNNTYTKLIFNYSLSTAAANSSSDLHSVNLINILTGNDGRNLHSITLFWNQNLIFTQFKLLTLSFNLFLNKIWCWLPSVGVLVQIRSILISLGSLSLDLTAFFEISLFSEDWLKFLLVFATYVLTIG